MYLKISIWRGGGGGGGGGLALLANYKINGSKGTSPIRYSELQVGCPNVKCKLTAIKKT